MTSERFVAQSILKNTSISVGSLIFLALLYVAPANITHLGPLANILAAKGKRFGNLLQITYKFMLL